MSQISERKFPTDAKDYKLCEEVGEGVSATVYRAICIPFNEVVAIKVLDLEKCNNDLDGIRREVQTMSLIDHPNLLRAHCSFTADHCLWVVMPYMAGGSCLHIMKSNYPEGFDQPVIATVLLEVLKALIYLHRHGHIHRDVKAGNILVDTNGSVKLADFGVSACMFDTGDRQRTRNTFVGTPCWMAPEVMQQLHGYDFKADIWSFGITALELAHGHAPFSKYPPMKVLLMTLQNAPPGLDYERDKRFSKSFRDLVSVCLVKDPKKRPTSEKLLKHPFFKHARPVDYLARTVLNGIAPLGERFKALKEKEANILLQNKTLGGDREHLSQQEYIRGISEWNFNLDDLKAQAALIPSEDIELDNNHTNGHSFVNHESQNLSLRQAGDEIQVEDEMQDIEDLKGAFSSAFPFRPLEALKTCFDVCEDETNMGSPKEAKLEMDLPQHKPLQVESPEIRKFDNEIKEKSPLPKHMKPLGLHKFLSGSLLPEHVLYPYNHIAGDAERAELPKKFQKERNPSGPLLHRHNNSSANTQEESLEGRSIRKGRFKITSADAGHKVTPSENGAANSVSGTNAASVVPVLQLLLQQNNMQKETIASLIKSVEQTNGHQAEAHSIDTSDSSQLPRNSSRVKELQTYATQLQQSIWNLSNELQRLRTKNAQLERQITALSNKERRREKDKASKI